MIKNVCVTDGIREFKKNGGHVRMMQNHELAVAFIVFILLTFKKCDGRKVKNVTDGK